MIDIYGKFQQDQEMILNKYVETYLSVKKYEKIMKKLRELDAYGLDNSYWYGDMDVYLYIETIDEKECLIIDNVVSCADNPLVILSINDHPLYDYQDKDTDRDYKILKKEVIAVCTNRESVKTSDNWGDRRDYKWVGLDTLKENGFRFLYGDCRDKEWAFNTRALVIDGYSDYENLSSTNAIYVLSEFNYAYDCLNDLTKR